MPFRQDGDFLIWETVQIPGQRPSELAATGHRCVPDLNRRPGYPSFPLHIVLSRNYDFAAVRTLACAFCTSNRACTASELAQMLFVENACGKREASSDVHVDHRMSRLKLAQDMVIPTCFLSLITLNLSKSVRFFLRSCCSLFFAQLLSAHFWSISCFSHNRLTGPVPADRGSFGMTKGVR